MSFDLKTYLLLKQMGGTSGPAGGDTCDCSVANFDTIINAIMDIEMVMPIVKDDNTIFIANDNTIIIQ